MQKGVLVGKKVPSTKKPAKNAGYLTKFVKALRAQRLNGRGNVEPKLCEGLQGHAYRWLLAS